MVLSAARGGGLGCVASGDGGAEGALGLGADRIRTVTLGSNFTV